MTYSIVKYLLRESKKKILAMSNFLKPKIRMQVEIVIFGPNPKIHLPTSVADPDPGSGAFLTPGSGMGKKSRARIQEEYPGNYSGEYSFSF
jgi:hypothetical protein